MAKDAKASGKRARETGDGAAAGVRRAERSAAKRLRRLEAELVAAMRDEARRRRQLSAAEAALRQAAADLAGFAATVGEAGADAAHDALGSARERLGALAGQGSQAASDAVVILGGTAAEAVAPGSGEAPAASLDAAPAASAAPGAPAAAPRRRRSAAPKEGAPPPTRRPRTRSGVVGAESRAASGEAATGQDVDRTPAPRRSLRSAPGAQPGDSG